MKFLFLVFSMLAHLTHAENLPSLVSVSNPNWSSEQVVADDKFPEYLEAHGDFTSAITEWRRVIYSTQNKNTQKRAYLHIANLYNKKHAYTQSLKAYEQFIALFPQSNQKDFLLEQINRLGLLTGDIEKSTMARHQLFKRTKGENFEEASERLESSEVYALWTAGLKGENIYFEPHSTKGQSLKENLDLFPIENHKNILKATILSLLPGAGYLYLGYINWAILILMVNLAFFYALMNAMKHKHWGYGLAFGTFSAFIYISSIFYTSTLATEKVYLKRVTEMSKWTDLQPKNVSDFKNLQTAFKPYPFSPNSKPLQKLFNN